MDMVQRHAYLTTGIERALAAGRQPPQQAVLELQRIEARAQATMSPMEVQQALNASQAWQAQMHQDAEMQSAMSEARERGYFTQQLSKDLTGMTPDQIELAKAGQLIPVKGKGQTPYKQNLRNMLKAEGLGDVPYEKFVKVADRVEDMKMAGKDPLPYLRQAFGKKAEAANSLIGAFHISGIGIEVGISGEPEKDHYVQPTEELQRRTTIADAMARSAMGDKHDREFLTSRIDPSYLESETSQGDVARAFAQHEMQDQAQERANYSAPDYDIADSDEEYENVSAF